MPFQMNIPLLYMLQQIMKRTKSSYHNLRTLKYAKPKLRKAIISNCDTDLVNGISESALNVLRGNVKLSD